LVNIYFTEAGISNPGMYMIKVNDGQFDYIRRFVVIF
jgi:hypothetical protein